MSLLARLNCTLDPLDERDKIFAASSTRSLPVSIDMRPLTSPVENQGRLSSCTGNGITSGMELLSNKKRNARTAVNLSRLFVYYNEREAEGHVNQDDGAYIRTGIKQVNKIGVCPETIWPYVERNVFVKPSAAAYATAPQNKLALYERCLTRANVLNALVAGKPVVFGFEVFSSFMSDSVASTGRMPFDKLPDDISEGGHCVLAVGYKMNCPVPFLTVQNSWGTSWGAKGFFYMPFSYYDKYAMDAWAIS